MILLFIGIAGAQRNTTNGKKLKKLKALGASPGDFNYSAFTEYLQGIAGGHRSLTTGKAIVADIERYITTLSQGSYTTKTDLLLHRKSIDTSISSRKGCRQQH